MEPFDTIIDYLRAGKSGTLATIISRVGAAPRAAGAKVFVGDDGQVYGTIGGGCVEAEVWQHARGVLRQEESKRLRYAMSGKTVEDEGMICGGTIELFLEPVTAKHKDIYETIFDCLCGDGRAIVFTSTEGTPFQKSLVTENGAILGDLSVLDALREFDELSAGSPPRIQGGLLIETVVSPDRLYIYGAAIDRSIYRGWQRPSTST